MLAAALVFCTCSGVELLYSDAGPDDDAQDASYAIRPGKDAGEFFLPWCCNARCTQGDNDQTDATCLKRPWSAIPCMGSRPYCVYECDVDYNGVRNGYGREECAAGLSYSGLTGPYTCKCLDVP